MEEIITNTEVTCKSLDQQTAASLRSEVAHLVKRKKPPKPNIFREEVRALQDLKIDLDNDPSPDKGRATVILDRG